MKHLAVNSDGIQSHIEHVHETIHYNGRRQEIESLKIFVLQASCKELFQDLLQKLSTSEYVWPPPKEMPQELYSNYTLNGRVQVRS